MKEKIDEIIDNLFQENMIMPTISLIVSIIAVIVSIVIYLK